MSSIVPFGEIIRVKFSIASDDDNKIDGFVHVKHPTVKAGSHPYPEGVLDSRMGTTSNNYRCTTCNQKRDLCPGHSGYIKLNYPVQNPLFKDYIFRWLKLICINCGEFMVSHKLNNVSKINKFQEYTKYVKKATKDKQVLCPSCEQPHPNIIKDKHDRLKLYIQYGNEHQTRLRNREIAQILDRVSLKTVNTVGMNPESHPRNLILSTINVPANSIRPDIIKNGSKGSSNDITVLFKNLVTINNSLPPEITEYTNTDLSGALDNLDLTYYTIVKGSSNSASKTNLTTINNTQYASLASRLPGKYGRFRLNIQGRRTRNACRTVISGDPSNPLEILGVPVLVAKIIHIPETVHSWNYDRLMTYYTNKDKSYPGCHKIKKKINGKTYYIGNVRDDFRIEEGDIIYRDMIDGDVIALNRAPSLTPASISCHKVRIMHTGNTMSFNVSVCNLYNADFDGDEMNGHVPLSLLTQVEIADQMSIGERFISFQYGKPVIGSFQDALIGGALFTKHGLKFSKFESMRMFARVIGKYSFTKDWYTAHELISMILPKFNFKGKPSIYDPSLAAYIKYKKEDITVHVEDGVLISGILDKKSVGQEASGGFAHIIKNQYGSRVAIDFVYNLQQIVTMYLTQRGFTVGIGDMLITKNAQAIIHDKTNAMIADSYRISEQLDNGKLIPPIGVSIKDYYEELQIAALDIPIDDYIQTIVSDIDSDNNGLYQIIKTGSKGSPTNLAAISSAIGSTDIVGRRIPDTFGYHRSFRYYTSHDNDPEAYGFVANSYISGLSPIELFGQAMNARIALINNALSTSVTGAQNRTSIKNLESQCVSNFRETVKGRKIIQMIYAESGIDPRLMEIARIPTANISDAEFNEYNIKKNAFHKKYHNSSLDKLLQDEFNMLLEDRNKYRTIMMAIEDSSGINNRIYGDKIKSPLNIPRIINDAIIHFNNQDKSDLNPHSALNDINNLCDDIPYTAFNEIQKDSKMPIPEHWVRSMTFTKILIRSHLNMKTMLDKKITNNMLSAIIEKIYITYSHAYINYGTAVGILAAQSLSEPMTQFVLDSKHRAGRSSGEKTDKMTRVEEILWAKPTDKMKNPSMIIHVSEEYETDKSKVQEIANHIEMMSVKQFIKNNDVQLFIEQYGNPVHKDFKHEVLMIKKFEKNNPSYKVPGDISNWCIRFELNRYEMILKNMSLDEIIKTLEVNFPSAYFVYTNENEDNLIIRMYMRNEMLGKKTPAEDQCKEWINVLMNTIIRGIYGIISAEVFVDTLPRAYIAEDGSIQTKKIYVIQTLGTNLSGVLSSPLVNKYKVFTDSIQEVAEIYGIEAARAKIMNEMKTINSANITEGPCHHHYTIYADEMTSTGRVTSIKHTGLAKREHSNTLLRMSMASPVQVIEKSAMNAITDNLEGVSSQIMIGSTPHFGTAYNQVVINEEFVNKYVERNSKQVDDILDNL